MRDKMARQTYPAQTEKRLIRRFWQSASGFWKGPSAWRVWLLTALLFITVVAQLLVQYWLNYWNRDFFNAIQLRDTVAVWTQAKIFAPLVVCSIAVAMVSIWGRMTMQRKWRQWAQQATIRLLAAEEPFRPAQIDVEGSANAGISDRRAATFIGIINSHEFFMCNFSVLFF
jgi:putative ATP-binding cassette transporter